MNVLFLTMLNISSLDNRGLYDDLIKEFTNNNHNIFIVSAVERKEKLKRKTVEGKNAKIIYVNTLNLQKSSIIEKGIGLLLIEYQYLKAIKRELSDIKFDLVIYNTPPITFTKVISYIKKRDNAFSYLLLKDIFPQNAVDLKFIKKNGFLHKFFLMKERNLYNVSDKIGCMSPANVEYLLNHNEQLSRSKVEVNPNSINPIKYKLTEEDKHSIRDKYNLPKDKMIFTYGGNLGLPQGIDFLLKIIDECQNENAFFLIVGRGTEFGKINNWIQKNKPYNVLLLNGLDKEEYELLLASCDVGMIFLHKDFTIPNFPSRMLSYLEKGMPILTFTDDNTDIGEIIEEHNCGLRATSGDILNSLKNIDKILLENDTNFKNMKKNARDLLEDKYLARYSYNYIVNSYNNR